MPLFDVGKVTHGLSRHPLCNAWYHLIDRCFNSKSAQYKDYGGRGITVADEWKDSPILFVKWAEENGWEKELELDRKNNDLGYFPSNCQFVLREINALNKRLIQTNNTTGFRGVCKQRKSNRFTVHVSYKGIKSYLGIFSDAYEAAKVRDNFIIKNDYKLPLNFPILKRVS